MKKQYIRRGTLLAALTSLLTGASTMAEEADEAAREEVRQAFVRLAAAENYTLTMVGEQQGKKPEELLSAKSGRSGWTMLRLENNGVWHEFVFHGNRGVVAAGDHWATIEDLQSEAYLSKLGASRCSPPDRTSPRTVTRIKCGSDYSTRKAN